MLCYVMLRLFCHVMLSNVILYVMLYFIVLWFLQINLESFDVISWEIGDERRRGGKVIRTITLARTIPRTHEFLVQSQSYLFGIQRSRCAARAPIGGRDSTSGSVSFSSSTVWCSVMWCDVMWCDVMWCDEMWCDVMWCVMSCHVPCHVMWCIVM